MASERERILGDLSPRESSFIPHHIGVAMLMVCDPLQRMPRITCGTAIVVMEGEEDLPIIHVGHEERVNIPKRNELRFKKERV